MALRFSSEGKKMQRRREQAGTDHLTVTGKARRSIISLCSFQLSVTLTHSTLLAQILCTRNRKENIEKKTKKTQRKLPPLEMTSPKEQFICQWAPAAAPFIMTLMLDFIPPPFLCPFPCIFRWGIFGFSLFAINKTSCTIVWGSITSNAV